MNLIQDDEKSEMRDLKITAIGAAAGVVACWCVNLSEVVEKGENEYELKTDWLPRDAAANNPGSGKLPDRFA